MPFWEGKAAPTAAASSAPTGPLLAAVACFAAYGAASITHTVAHGLLVSWAPEEIVRGVFRLAAASGLAYALWRRAPWAWWAGVVIAALGVVGLLGAGLALSSAGAAGLPLGTFSAAMALFTGLCLAAPAFFLTRPEAKAQFFPPERDGLS